MGDNSSSEQYTQLVEHLSDNEKLELITLLSESLRKSKKSKKKADSRQNVSNGAETDFLLSSLSKPTRPTLDLDELAREQNYRGGDQERFDRKAAKLNITEPIEKLLAQLTP